MSLSRRTFRSNTDQVSAITASLNQGKSRSQLLRPSIQTQFDGHAEGVVRWVRVKTVCRKVQPRRIVAKTITRFLGDASEYEFLTTAVKSLLLIYSSFHCKKDTTRIKTK